TLSITPAPLVVLVANATKVYGQDDSAALTGTVSGVQNDDPIAAGYFSSGSVASAAPGKYGISAVLSDFGTGKLARDYDGRIVPGTLTVNRDGTTTQVTSSPNPSPYGQAVTYSVSVTANAPGSGTPTGGVTFFDGSTILGVGTLSGGATTFTDPKPAAGIHTI